MIQVGTLLVIGNRLHIVYDIRKDGKIYFHSMDKYQFEFTTTIEEIVEQEWEVLY